MSVLQICMKSYPDVYKRQDNSVLVYGKYQLLQKEHEKIYAYTRELGDTKMLVLLNFTKEKALISLPEVGNVQKMIINNYDSFEIKGNEAKLLPYQAVIFEISH